MWRYFQQPPLMDRNGTSLLPTLFICSHIHEETLSTYHVSGPWWTAQALSHRAQSTAGQTGKQRGVWVNHSPYMQWWKCIHFLICNLTSFLFQPPTFRTVAEMSSESMGDLLFPQLHINLEVSLKKHWRVTWRGLEVRHCPLKPVEATCPLACAETSSIPSDAWYQPLQSPLRSGL